MFKEPISGHRTMRFETPEPLFHGAGGVELGPMQAPVGTVSLANRGTVPRTEMSQARTPRGIPETPGEAS